jgi:hypothetical protein
MGELLLLFDSSPYCFPTIKTIDSYRNLSHHIPDEGMQIVMFTHQNVAVWADLALILWASGLLIYVGSSW